MDTQVRLDYTYKNIYISSIFARVSCAHEHINAFMYILMYVKCVCVRARARARAGVCMNVRVCAMYICTYVCVLSLRNVYILV